MEVTQVQRFITGNFIGHPEAGDHGMYAGPGFPGYQMTMMDRFGDDKWVRVYDPTPVTPHPVVVWQSSAHKLLNDEDVIAEVTRAIMHGKVEEW